MVAVTGDTVVLHGGWRPQQSALIKNDTWVFNESDGWEELSLGVSPPNWGPLAYDVENNRLVLYIGVLETTDGGWQKTSFTWSFDPASEQWVDLSSDSGPSGLLGPAQAYDIESDRIVLFGGLDPVEWELSSETWSYDLNSNTWAKMNPPEGPSARNYPAFAYDSDKDRVVLFGGLSEETYGDTWIYDLNSDMWSQVTPELSPSPRAYSAMTYEPQSNQIILFGGVDASGRPLADLWLFDLEAGAWKELAQVEKPSGRGWHAMATLEGGKILMFGGGASRDEFTNDTWLYESASNKWVELTR